jgi:tetratricopeptide (TPR) repeat protein
MLETVREFAVERLWADSDQGPATARAHAGYVLALAEDAFAGLVGAEQQAWLARLDAEDANVRAALLWSTEQGPPEAAARLARALWRYWLARGRLREGRSWLERALALPGLAEAPPRVVADTHNALGNLLVDSAEYTLARQHYEEALALRRQIADSDGIAAALHNLGIVAAWLGDYQRALAHYRESLELRRMRHDDFGMALSFSTIGDVQLAQGDFSGAQQHHADALRLRERLRDAGGSAYSIYNLGEVARLRGDAAEAARLLAESLTRFEALGEQIGIAYCACSLGDLASQEGNPERAAALLARSLRTRTEMGDKRGIIECQETLAMAAIRAGAERPGLRLLGAAAAARDALACPVPPSTQRAYDRVLGGARERLGAAEATALREEGRLLGDEQAARLAAEILDRLGSTSAAKAAANAPATGVTG